MVYGQEQFYGRKNKLDLLKRRVSDLKEGYRQNMAFLGDRFAGKSMVIKKFLSDLDDDRIVSVYIELENADLGYFVYKMAGSLLYHFLKNRGICVGDDLAVLAGAAEPFLPQTVKSVRNAQGFLTQGRIKDAYLEIIGLPQIFAQEADVFCVLFLDEFQHIEDFGVKDDFVELGQGIMTQRRCLYVVTSSQPWSAQKILSEKLTLLFGHFEIIEIRPFDIQSCREFIALQLNGLKISEPLVHFLTDFTGGQPLYLTLICEELRSLCALHHQRDIFLPLLSLAVEKILNSRWGVLSRHFDLMMERYCSGTGNVPVARILLALAGGRQKLGDLAEKVGLKLGVVSARLNRLLETGVVAKNGNYFFIPDRLFKVWLNFVLTRRRRVIEEHGERQGEDFREAFACAYEQSAANTRREVTSQVQDLLSCFENESLSINGRRYKLPAFKNMTPTRLTFSDGGHLDLIRACADEGEWAIFLKSGQISENEIARMLAETRKFILKPQRCVLICLDHLDENARVRALQERMWIWNEGELSALTAIFDKSLIIGPTASEG